MKTRVAFFLILSAIVGSSFFSACRQPNPPLETNVDAAPMQKNPDWEFGRVQGGTSEYAPQISGIMLGFDRQENLLITFANSSRTFKYDRSNKSISPSSESEWIAATGRIVCRERDSLGSEQLVLDEETATLRFRNSSEVISTSGRFVLRIMDSPQKNMVLVLSADGPRTQFIPGIWGFGGRGGETYGARYVQFYSMNDKIFLGEPIGLLSLNDPPIFRFCWTDNENYVVAYEVEHNDTGWIEIDFHVIKLKR